MKAAMIVQFEHPIAGREKLALDYGVEVNEYFGKLASDGKCSFPEYFLSTIGGRHLWMVKGELKTLEEIEMVPAAQKLLTKGGLLFEEFTYAFHVTGEGADEYLLNFAEAAQGLALI